MDKLRCRSVNIPTYGMFPRNLGKVDSSDPALESSLFFQYFSKSLLGSADDSIRVLLSLIESVEPEVDVLGFLLLRGFDIGYVRRVNQ